MWSVGELVNDGYPAKRLAPIRGGPGQSGGCMATTQDETIIELRCANVELQQERDAALAREAALAKVLGVINRSPGDPGPVFDAILEMAHRLCGADAGALMRYDGEHFHAVATHGLPDEFETLVRRPFRGASHQRLIDGERIVHVADARIVQWGELDEVERAFVERTNLQTSLFVSLSKDGNLLGFISADRKHAADDRAARGTGTTDRNRRGIAGDQRLAGRLAASVRHDAGKGTAVMRRNNGCHLHI